MALKVIGMTQECPLKYSPSELVVEKCDGLGAFCFDEKSVLAILEGKQNSIKYCGTLDSYMVPFLRKIQDKNGEKSVCFQHDNASIHASRYTTTHLRSLGIKTMNWPSKSPDLNPIENVWDMLARAVYSNGRQFENVEELKQMILSEWNNLSQNYFKTLVDSMPTRMVQVVFKRGAIIDY